MSEPNDIHPVSKHDLSALNDEKKLPLLRVTSVGVEHEKHAEAIIRLTFEFEKANGQAELWQHFALSPPAAHLLARQLCGAVDEYLDRDFEGDST